ncbi:cell division protein SepF [Propioniferax innocua]|uniref:Cell division protein SepF n=1 Tax=Propioniferax innocua TaxID=1753 RepID=A0A542ZBJ0_9ACTN|nr:cell division protein SepF [Propioniferax innocua]TQL57696.1 cell division inhibitor SepF [Propioniferax innocua]
MGSLKNAAAWLGLVADDRYDDYDEDDRRRRDGRHDDELEDEYTEDVELTEGVGAEDSAEVHEIDRRRGDRPATRRPGETSARGGVARTESTRDPEPEPSVADLSRIITVCPRTYNEARTIGEHFRDGVPVIMNLSEMEDTDAKRLVDFAAGLIFGLHGRIERVTNKVFLLSPKNVTVTAEDKERIAGGFYNQS